MSCLVRLPPSVAAEPPSLSLPAALAVVQTLLLDTAFDTASTTTPMSQRHLATACEASFSSVPRRLRKKKGERFHPMSNCALAARSH